jgi:hypothetical protein
VSDLRPAGGKAQLRLRVRRVRRATDLVACEGHDARAVELPATDKHGPVVLRQREERVFAALPTRRNRKVVERLRGIRREGRRIRRIGADPGPDARGSKVNPRSKAAYRTGGARGKARNMQRTREPSPRGGQSAQAAVEAVAPVLALKPGAAALALSEAYNLLRNKCRNRIPSTRPRDPLGPAPLKRRCQLRWPPRQHKPLPRARASSPTSSGDKLAAVRANTCAATGASKMIMWLGPTSTRCAFAPRRGPITGADLSVRSSRRAPRRGRRACPRFQKTSSASRHSAGPAG